MVDADDAGEVEGAVVVAGAAGAPTSTAAEATVALGAAVTEGAAAVGALAAARVRGALGGASFRASSAVPARITPTPATPARIQREERRRWMMARAEPADRRSPLSELFEGRPSAAGSGRLSEGEAPSTASVASMRSAKAAAEGMR